MTNESLEITNYYELKSYKPFQRKLNISISDSSHEHTLSKTPKNLQKYIEDSFNTKLETAKLDIAKQNKVKQERSMPYSNSLLVGGANNPWMLNPDEYTSSVFGSNITNFTRIPAGNGGYILFGSLR